MLNALDQFFSTRMLALDLRAQRSETLASNIANADTPGYKARDFDFATVFEGALKKAGGVRGPLEVARTSPHHLQGAQGSHNGPQLQYRIPVQASIDGNTVELDSELGQFTDNALHYQADLTFLSQNIRTLQSAITGQ